MCAGCSGCLCLALALRHVENIEEMAGSKRRPIGTKNGVLYRNGDCLTFFRKPRTEKSCNIIEKECVFQDQQVTLNEYTGKGIDLLERIQTYAKERASIELEYSAKLK